jgi:hypothetical protein
VREAGTTSVGDGTRLPPDETDDVASDGDPDEGAAGAAGAGVATGAGAWVDAHPAIARTIPRRTTRESRTFPFISVNGKISIYYDSVLHFLKIPWAALIRSNRGSIALSLKHFQAFFLVHGPARPPGPLSFSIGL